MRQRIVKTLKTCPLSLQCSSVHPIIKDVQSEMKLLVDQGEIRETKFFEVVQTYETCVEYINKWKSSLGSSEKFQWILLKKYLNGLKFRTVSTTNSSYELKQMKLAYLISVHV